jgi:uncharacterized membrane protein
VATQRGGKKPTSKARSSGSDFYIPPVPVAVAVVRKSLGEEMIAWIACCVLIALLLPLMGILYLDVLETKKEANVQLEKVEKLRRQVEQQQRKGKNDD